MTGTQIIKHITLPWPNRRLSPNSPGNWQSKLTARQQARNDGYLEARLVYDPADDNPLSGELQVRYTLRPPTRRHYDQDNVLAGLKSHIDGVCQGLGIDDQQFRRTVIEWADPLKGGRVEMEIRELS